MKDKLGDRMKEYENSANIRLDKTLPIMVRIDGRCFSKFTKGLLMPYDIGMSKLMILTSKEVVQNTHALCAYTQSDEITVAFGPCTENQDMLFGGRVQKLASTIASLATYYFNKHLADYVPSHVGKLATFDCRVWNVPDFNEMANCFKWRMQDCMRNSIQSAGRACFSHNEMQNKNTDEIRSMLLNIGINWHAYPNFFKYGTYIMPNVVKKTYTTEELESLPEKHHAKTTGDLSYVRTEYVEYSPSNNNQPEVLLNFLSPFQ